MNGLVMRNDEQEVLKKAIELLGRLAINSDEKCHIMAETGYDESIVIGTDSAYMALGKKIIEFIYCVRYGDTQNSFDFDHDEIEGIHNVSSDVFKRLFDDMGDVWPVCFIVAKDNNDVNLLVDVFHPDG